MVATRVESSATDVVDIGYEAIRVADLDRAPTFYHDLLGLPIRDRDRFDAGDVPYVVVVTGGWHVHLVPTDEAIDVGGEHPCLLVRSDAVDSRAEVEALLDRLREHDVEVDHRGAAGARRRRRPRVGGVLAVEPGLVGG